MQPPGGDGGPGKYVFDYERHDGSRQEEFTRKGNTDDCLQQSPSSKYLQPSEPHYSPNASKEHNDSLYNPAYLRASGNSPIRYKDSQQQMFAHGSSNRHHNNSGGSDNQNVLQDQVNNIQQNSFYGNPNNVSHGGSPHKSYISQ